MDYKEPPFGAMPDFIWRELRVTDLTDAINRCLNHEKSAALVNEWMIERAEHKGWLLRREKNNQNCRECKKAFNPHRLGTVFCSAFCQRLNYQRRRYQAKKAKEIVNP